MNNYINIKINYSNDDLFEGTVATGHNRNLTVAVVKKGEALG